ncbi:hypothetical protein P3T76_013623 [Phytophthora citrophthora]|uniref:Uncharacterized protein n=1 Tax=Phytophthora citrophthora TaxID=4793 RepID=A0AAD9G2S1_9STRA|nr:hypothetical protein P3T76_013623 [Phytophthora citrophthora]
MEAADVVARLRLLQQDEDENLELSTHAFGAYVDYVEEEVVESESPVMDSFFLQGGNRVLKTMTNFTQSEYELLWSIVEGDLYGVWNLGRGGKSKTTAKDGISGPKTFRHLGQARC